MKNTNTYSRKELEEQIRMIMNTQCEDDSDIDQEADNDEKDS